FFPPQWMRSLCPPLVAKSCCILENVARRSIPRFELLRTGCPIIEFLIIRVTLSKIQRPIRLLTAGAKARPSKFDNTGSPHHIGYAFRTADVKDAASWFAIKAA